MNRLILDVLPEGLMDEVKTSFDHLPQSNHSDGGYRARRYSRIDFYGLNTGKTDFIQSSDYNKHQGDVERNFEAVDDDVLGSKIFRDLYGRFREASDLFFEDVDVHQMRIFTEIETVPVSPEGIHQDGYHTVGIFGVNRHNIEGGEALVFMDRDGPPIFSRRLETGEFIIFDDENLWHSAKPIRTIDKEKPGYMDAFILTAKRDE
jgi:hypothetical protein